ncbi:MAG: TPM domain-containing protein [Sulfuritalea sp.]|nr:TPM domain-containing protein [Sulfuritalea sp.]
MRRIRAGLLTLLWLALLPAFGWAAELVPLPALTARITDLTATLDATQRGRLEAQLAAVERTRGAQIAVLILPSTQPEAIEQFGIRLAEAWKIGHKGADNGVIVIVAKDDRQMRIEVGYGLEGAIPDAVASRIVNERMAPRFRQGDFFGGLQAAIEGLDQAIAGDAPGAPAVRPSGSGSPRAEDSGLFPWLMGAVVAGGVLRAMFGILGALAAAAVAGWLGFVIFGSWLAAALAGVVIFVLSFFNLGSRGGGLGGGGFSGGGGGFSGGGGGFGGGGASGRW